MCSVEPSLYHHICVTATLSSHVTPSPSPVQTLHWALQLPDLVLSVPLRDVPLPVQIYRYYRYIDIQGSVDMCRYPAVPVLQLQPLCQRDAVRLEGKREGGELGLYVLVRQILGTENIAFLFHGLKVVLCFTINTRIGGFLPAVSKITGDLKTFYTIKCVSFHTWARDWMLNVINSHKIWIFFSYKKSQK